MNINGLNIVIIAAILFMASACTSTDNNNNTESKKNVQPVKTKPPSTYQDTLSIYNKAAVFYFPDSLQLNEIEKITDKNVFESLNHEFFYQIRNAKNVIKDNMPTLPVNEAKNVRFIKFIKESKTSIIIDLDSKMDSYGLFLFDGKQDPKMADMMNIDSELWFYFKNPN